jgi:regulatory protein
MISRKRRRRRLSNTQTAEIRKNCLRLLSRREYSRLELQNRLQAKGWADNLIQGVLADLAAEGWQSDSRFADNYARQRIGKGYGPLRIENELRLRGIEDFDLESIVEDAADGWVALLEKVYLRKYAHASGISIKEWARRNRFLLQRGFTGESIRTLVKKLNIKFD